MRLTLLCVMVVTVSLCAAHAGEIHDAAREGDLDAVRAIVEADPTQLNEQDVRNDAPIHLASIGGHTELVRYLLDAGALIDIGDNENTTALGCVAIHGHMDIAELLIERGAAVDVADDNGNTPLRWAVYNMHGDLARLFIDHGASLDVVGGNGSTLLHGAAYGGNADLVQLLLDHDADVNARNGALYTPLLSGIVGRAGVDVLQMLIDAGADVHDRNGDGYNAFTLAARRDTTDVAVYLMEQGVSTHARADYNGMSALHNAAAGGNTALIEILLDDGANIDEECSDGWTALTWAVIRNQVDAAALLLERGANPDPARADGKTPLHELLRDWDPEFATLLLEHGANVDARETPTGRTFLHKMALSGLTDGVELAIEHGANINAVDDAGMTPLQYAGRYGHRGVAEYLMAQGASATDLEENYGRHELLDRAVASGEASMWYLGHCGWAVRTDDHFMIFDYWPGGLFPETPCLANGCIDPAEIADENVYVFVTHEHGDHFDPVIFDWVDELPNVTYVFGFRPELQPQYRQAGYEGPDYQYIGPREHVELDGMNIRTLAANDAGVGFLVEVDGLVLYHAGDHAGWAEGERDGYFAEIDYLAPFIDELDMAFVNVTGCHAHDPDALVEGNLYTIDAFQPKLIVPTHGGGREHVYNEAEAVARENGVETPFCCPANRGDSYVYSGGELM